VFVFFCKHVRFITVYVLCKYRRLVSISKFGIQSQSGGRQVETGQRKQPWKRTKNTASNPVSLPISLCSTPI